MDFSFTEEQEMLRQTARDFAEKELRPGVAERDEKGVHPEDKMKQLAELGFFGIIASEEYGGSGFDTVAYIAAMEEIARIDPSTEVMLSINNSLICYPLEKFGNDFIKSEFLPKFASGEWWGAFCLTEPGSGSDAVAMKSRAVKDGDEWVINGSKNFITGGNLADAFLYVCVTDPEAGAKGTSAFLVPADTPGIEIGKHEIKMGMRATDTVSLTFDDVRVPNDYLIGDLGMGFKIMMTALDSGRMGVAAQGLGIAQAALEESIKYSQERQQFGRPIARFQAIQFKLADMQMRVSSARHMLYHASWLKDAGKKFTMESAMAKVYCSEAATWCAEEAVQIHGGYGYSREYPVERLLRDAKVTEIYEGTNEIQRIVISRQILG